MNGFIGKKILLYGYGNPGRGDDGLGSAFIQSMDEWIQKKKLRHISTECNYQLNIEDASTLSQFDAAIFVDASRAEIEAYSFSPVHPAACSAFTTHAVSAGAVVALCAELYGVTPLVYLLQIKGYCWDFGTGLSIRAKKNLQKALHFVQRAVIDLQKK